MRSPAENLPDDRGMEEIGRPLTNAERACWLIDQVSPMKFVMVAHLRLRAPIDRPTVRRALDRVQARHPLLRVGIVPGRPPHYRRIEREIPLRWVERRGPDTWQAEVDRERETPMDAEAGPLVRLTVVESADRWEVLVTFHHVMSDGMSGVYLIKDLLGLVAAAGEASLEVVAAPALPMRPGVEDLLGPVVRGWGGAARTWRYVLDQIRALFRGPEKLAEEQAIPLDQRKSRSRALVFEPAVHTALLTRCRAEKTTMHGLIVASALIAVARHLRGDRARVVLLGCCTPVNLRAELVPPIGEEIGMFVAPIVSFHEVGPDTSLWALARGVREVVQGARADHAHATAIATQSRLLPRRATAATATGLLYHPLFGAIAVTNMGAPEIGPEFGPLRLERLDVAPNADPFGSLLSLAVVTVAERMVVNFNYNEGILSLPTIDGIVADTERTLRGAAEPAPA